jgi:hypothetical protein
LPRYYLEIDEDERMLFLIALSVNMVNRKSGMNLMRRLLEAPKLPEGEANAPTTLPSAGMSTAVPVARGAGAHSSPTAPERDKTVPEQEPFGELTITPVNVCQSVDGKAMVVTYRIRSGARVRTTSMRCWDPSLFSTLLASKDESTTFLTKESKGFTNIVGVKR